MSPREQNNSVLTSTIHTDKINNELTPLTEQQQQQQQEKKDQLYKNSSKNKCNNIFKHKSTLLIIILLLFITINHFYTKYNDNNNNNNINEVKTNTLTYPSGSYKLIERQVGNEFFNSYEFINGPDSIGSAGYNTYVSKERAIELNIINITYNKLYDESYIYMSSASTIDGPRESIRIEGKKYYNHGLFIIDILHMPVGCGQWPAFWLTDDNKYQWPKHGEIDIIEGINYQSYSKTALHTSESCSMWQQVPPYSKTGTWDRAEGLYDRYTGNKQNDSYIPADNCYIKSPHQWMNQGCVAVSDQNNTIGIGFNQQEGGIYVLEWDPYNGYIRSWVFPRSNGIPENIQNTILTSSKNKDKEKYSDIQDTIPDTIPDPNNIDWGVPYAYFAIGDNSDCSSNHFQNMHLIFNLAFCGTVAGNRYFNDCKNNIIDNNEFITNNPLHMNDPILACNEYIKSNPNELNDAYWKIKGVYVYERS